VFWNTVDFEGLSFKRRLAAVLFIDFMASRVDLVIHPNLASLVGNFESASAQFA
jgi:hypothetical protein